MYDTIVIGSGIGGLTAALTCARAGQRVLVLEAAKQFGGYLNPFARKKFRFDTGLHYVGSAQPGHALHRLFDELDVDVSFNELTPEGFDWYCFPDYNVKLCKGAEAFEARLAADFPAERQNLQRFFGLLGAVERGLNLASKIRDARSALKAARELSGVLRWRRATLKQLLDHYFSDPLLKAALSGPCGDLRLPPGRLSAPMHLILLGHFLSGGYYPQGGSGAVRDGYVKALAREGAELRRNTPVATIDRSSGRVTGVTTVAGEHIEARCVVSNAEATATYRMAGLERSSLITRRRLARVEPSCASFMVFLGVEGDLAGNTVGDNNVWHYGSADIDAIYSQIDRGPSQEMLFITVPSLKDPDGGKAPAGHHVVELVSLTSPAIWRDWFGKPTLKRGAEYDALKRRHVEPLVEVAERYIPGLSGKVVLSEVSSPATNAHYVNNDSGQIYGPAHTPGQVLLGRFRPSAPLDGLYLCGASVFCGGVMACADSGRLAGKLALNYVSEQRPRSVVSRALRRVQHDVGQLLLAGI